MITKLHIHQFRNLGQVSFSLAKCNLFLGENGSGKTSLLEAVFLLSRGKSFRHHEPRRYISHHQPACVVWAKTDADDGQTLAIKKQINAQKSDTLLKIDGQTAKSQSALSQRLPTLLIDPTGMSLLDEGSGARRQMLDWLAFHQLPDFYQAWLHHQRLLKQRNSLLKQSHTQYARQQIAAWDHQLAQYAQMLHECRLQIFLAWQERFDQVLSQLLPQYHEKISLQYSAGFDTKAPLVQTLAARLSQDVELGYTRIGAHRADVAVLLKSQNEAGQKLREQASHILSRGEKKLLIVALRLSQLLLICQQKPSASVNAPLVLIDDIDAELDERAVDLLLDTLLPLPCQLMVTSLHAHIHQKIQEKLAKLAPSDQAMTAYQLFHVKQGEVLTD